MVEVALWISVVCWLGNRLSLRFPVNADLIQQDTQPISVSRKTDMRKHKPGRDGVESKTRHAHASTRAPLCGSTQASTRFLFWCAFVCVHVEHQIYEALTDEKLIATFTRAPARVDAQESGSFALFGGSAVGSFTALVSRDRYIWNSHIFWSGSGSEYQDCSKVAFCRLGRQPGFGGTCCQRCACVTDGVRPSR